MLELMSFLGDLIESLHCISNEEICYRKIYGLVLYSCFLFFFLIILILIFKIRMSKQAAEILQKFYLQLRDRNTSADGTPITARQLESLVRLAEARARLDLREEITAQDAMVNTL